MSVRSMGRSPGLRTGMAAFVAVGLFAIGVPRTSAESGILRSERPDDAHLFVDAELPPSIFPSPPRRS